MVLGAQLMVVRGKLQREGIVIHVVADAMLDRSDLLARLNETDASAGPFRAPIAHADQQSSGPPDPRDPFWRPRDLDHFRSHPHIYRGLLGSPEARPAKRATVKLDPRDAGFKSRDFR